MKTIIVKTQAEFDAAKKKKDSIIEIRSEIGTAINVDYCDISSRVEALGSSSVEAWGSSRVEARESSRVEARGSSRVEAWGSSSVEAWGSSRVEARESSSVVALGSSSVEAWGSSRVEARESSSVVARGSSSVVARGSSRVEALGSSRVEAWESSSVVARESSSVEAWGSSRVEAWESSRVEARESSSVVAWGSSSVEAWGSSRVEAWESSRVEARESSSVALYGFAIVALANLSFGGSIEAFNSNVVQIHWNSEGKIKGATEIKMTPIEPSLDSFKKHYPTETKENGKMRWYKTVRKTEGGKFVANYDRKFEYRIGEIAKEKVEFDPDDTCGAGIHVSGKQWALEFGRYLDDCALLELEVDPEKIFVSSDTDGKVRCSECLVVREVPKDEWYA